MNTSEYKSYVGSSLTITCTANYLRPIDIIWSMYPVYAPKQRTIIYSVCHLIRLFSTDQLSRRFLFQDNQYQGAFASRYRVDIDEISFANLTTSLTIKSVLLSDSMYSYECECNVYRTCSNGAVAKASAILIALTTSKKSLLSNYRTFISTNLFNSNAANNNSDEIRREKDVS